MLSTPKAAPAAGLSGMVLCLARMGLVVVVVVVFRGPALLVILSGPCSPLSLICCFLCNFSQCNGGVALS